MKILRQAFLAAIFFLIVAASVSADTLIVRAESSQEGVPVVTLFDYFENGATIWALDVLGSFPVLYGGFSRNFNGGFSAEIVPGVVFNREQGLNIQDIVLDVDFFVNRGRFATSAINELGGLKQGPLTLFGDHEATATFGKWHLGLRHVSFFSPSVDFVHLGPILGRQYGPVRFTIWPWRNVLGVREAGLLFQAKAVFSY